MDKEMIDEICDILNNGSDSPLMTIYARDEMVEAMEEVLSMYRELKDRLDNILNTTGLRRW